MYINYLKYLNQKMKQNNDFKSQVQFLKIDVLNLELI